MFHHACASVKFESILHAIVLIDPHRMHKLLTNARVVCGSLLFLNVWKKDSKKCYRQYTCVLDIISVSLHFPTLLNYFPLEKLHRQSCSLILQRMNHSWYFSSCQFEAGDISDIIYGRRSSNNLSCQNILQIKIFLFFFCIKNNHQCLILMHAMPSWPH